MALTLKSIRDAKPEALVLVGLPGSGKSTWAAAFPGQYPVLSTDAHIDEYAARNNMTYRQSYDDCYNDAVRTFSQEVKAHCRAGRPFIWDQINARVETREDIYRILSPTHSVTYVCFLVPLDLCIARVKERPRDGGELMDERRVREIASFLRFPDKTTGEPFDKIVRIRHPDWKGP